MEPCPYKPELRQTNPARRRPKSPWCGAAVGRCASTAVSTAATDSSRDVASWRTAATSLWWPRLGPSPVGLQGAYLRGAQHGHDSVAAEPGHAGLRAVCLFCTQCFLPSVFSWPVCVPCALSCPVLCQSISALNKRPLLFWCRESFVSMQ